MTPETILTNALLVLPDEVIAGTVVIRGGTHRARCSPAAATLPGAQTSTATT